MIDPKTPADVLIPIREAGNTAKDALVVYYAGHGIVAMGGAYAIALLESRRDPQYMYTFLLYSEIRQMMNSFPRNLRKVVILDACFSARVMQYGIQTGKASSGEAVGPLTDINGTAVLTATSAQDAATFEEGARNTEFTRALIEVLRGGSPNAGPFLSLEDVHRLTRERLQSNNGALPEVFYSATAFRLSISRNVAHNSLPDRADPDASANSSTTERTSRVSDLTSLPLMLATGFPFLVIALACTAIWLYGFFGGFFWSASYAWGVKGVPAVVIASLGTCYPSYVILSGALWGERNRNYLGIGFNLLAGFLFGIILTVVKLVNPGFLVSHGFPSLGWPVFFP
ncbi:caspase family protein [Streptomyces sp. NPDC057236]|uniref:caspase family protein n=1 Tax=Streptomyces sp. NPDC057236 TaxID=3346059 RepID=UPI0036428EB1